MQYSRQDIIEEIKKIFEQNPNDTTAADLDDRAKQRMEKAAEEQAKADAEKQKRTAAAEKAKAKAAAAQAAKDQAAAAIAKAQADDKDIHKQLDNKFQVIIKTIRALRAQPVFEEPEDYSGLLPDLANNKKMSGANIPDVPGGKKRKELLFLPYQEMYQEKGYDQIYQKLKGTLLSEPNETTYLQQAKTNWTTIHNDTINNLSETISMASKQLAAIQREYLTNSVGAAGGPAGAVQFRKEHDASPWITARKQARNKINRKFIKTVKKVIIDSLENDIGFQYIPFFYWPLYVDGHLNPGFGIYYLLPRVRDHEDPSKLKVYSGIPKILIGNTFDEKRYHYALGFGNWAYAANIAGAVSPVEIREANKIKFDILSKKLPSTRMVYSDTTGIRDRMNWHVKMLTSFEEALGNRSLADEKITEECLLIVKNYKFHLKKLSGMVATLSGSRLGDNMGEIALHGGVVTSAMDTLFQPSY